MDSEQTAQPTTPAFRGVYLEKNFLRPVFDSEQRDSSKLRSSKRTGFEMKNTVTTSAVHPPQSPDPNSHKDALKHAWSWVSVYSAQRQQSIYFFLVAASFLTQAYVAAVDSGRLTVAASVSVLGLVVTICLFSMEERHSMQVTAGESAMLRAEIVLEHQTRTGAFDIIRNVGGSRHAFVQRWPSRLLYCSSVLGFGTAFIGTICLGRIP